jgi:hypothetical protein
MRVITFILLALTVFYSTLCFSKDKIDYDCSKANDKCQLYVVPNAYGQVNYCQEIPRY